MATLLKTRVPALAVALMPLPLLPSPTSASHLATKAVTAAQYMPQVAVMVEKGAETGMEAAGA